MSYLLKPLKSGKLILKNRLIFPPMATYKAKRNGMISCELLDYYDKRSKGGYISLIIIEHSFISKIGKAGNNQISISDDIMIDGLAKLADVIHKNGSKTVIQLNHAGSSTDKNITGSIPLGPSPVANPCKGGIPRKLSIFEIKNIVNDFAKAALRAKKAGFDGVEIHSAHGYLLNQFLSPLTNKRTDEYGIDIYGRIRIHLEIVKAVRKIVGDDFPILLRLGASDYMDGGTTIEDSKIAASELEKAGVDILDISGGFCRYTIPGVTVPGYFSPLSEAIKSVVSVPVILTGGITKGQHAEKLLADEKADLIGVGRAIYKDFKWPEKTIKSLSNV